MNIAKFKDIIIDNTNNGTNLSATEIDLFNTKLVANGMFYDFKNNK